MVARHRNPSSIIENKSLYTKNKLQRIAPIEWTNLKVGRVPLLFFLQGFNCKLTVISAYTLIYYYNEQGKR